MAAAARLVVSGGSFGAPGASAGVRLLGRLPTACWLGATGWAQRKEMVMPWVMVAELLERCAAGPGGQCEDRADSEAGATFGVVFTDPVRRQPESVQLVTRGETAVKLELEKLGWGRNDPKGPRRVNLFRSLTAGRSFQILLDDAVTAAQIKDLLPGRGRSMVIVTGQEVSARSPITKRPSSTSSR
ncbi:hypothetical protein [Lentzea sp. E54]|uniref:hypothetical protein n=1 Tax=Lentzea xerophila TaxID=3435883 RepID=UPI003DA1F74A